jgi:protein gp37
LNKTKIEWCDMTWNPVTGCQNWCEYCYARGIANRFGGNAAIQTNNAHYIFSADGYEIDFKHVKDDGSYAPFPFWFKPTFHKYRLDEPAKINMRKSIFVCSMADLFGEWVPDEWIEAVLKHCAIAPWHTYLFLTKNPERYTDAIDYIEGERSPLIEGGLSAYFGATVTNEKQLYTAYESPATWLSIEPMLEDITGAFEEFCIMYRPPDSAEVPRWSWVVLGAETGNRKSKIIPKREWVEKLVEDCRYWKIPIFMKNSLADIWGEPLIQEYPWEVPENAGAEA